jgi:hypothetical protein
MPKDVERAKMIDRLLKDDPSFHTCGRTTCATVSEKKDTIDIDDDDDDVNDNDNDDNNYDDVSEYKDNGHESDFIPKNLLERRRQKRR